MPEALRAQLKIGGRLVIPVGANARAQELVRVTRVGENDYRREDLADVRFVPLLGHEGWEPEAPAPEARRVVGLREAPLQRTIADAAEPFASIESADLAPLLDRIGNARVVLLGEASHGTSEFYSMRERISRELIGARASTSSPSRPTGRTPPASTTMCAIANIRRPNGLLSPAFPTWMWRNIEVRNFVDWLRGHNAGLKPASARRLPRPRPLQPLRFHPLRARISRRASTRHRPRLRASDTVA